MIAGSDPGGSPYAPVRQPQRRCHRSRKIVRHRLGRYGKAAGLLHTFNRRLCWMHVQSKCVMARMNWSHIASRNRMRRQGVEDINGKVPLFAQPPKKPRRKLSKAELRQRAAAAFLAWREGQTSKDK